jgi:hypothetical protein
VRQRPFEFFELNPRAMHFEPNEIRHLEHFREQSADVLDVREKTLGISVAFAAKDVVTVNAETVEEVFFLSRGFLNEAREPGLDRLPLSGMRFEIGVKGNEV